jgi:hypothetical protein
MVRVAVVGAGLAGLTAATYLSKKDVEVTVFEGSDRVGGRVTSDLIDGFICDRGFQVINPNYSEIKKLDLIQGLDFMTISPNMNIDGVNYGLNHPYNLIKILPKLNSKVLNPFLKGVFLTDPSNLNTNIAREIKKSFVFGRPGIPKLGVAKFSEALASRVRKINLNCQVEEIKDGLISGGFGNDKFDAVIVATDPVTATRLTGIQNYRDVLPSITWYHSTKNSLLDSEYLRISSSGELVNSVVISNVSSSLAPVGYSLIASTALHDINERDLKSELSKLWNTSTENWELVKRYEISQSLPLRTDSTKFNPKIREKLYLAGDHVDIPSQNGAMRSGRRAAEAVLKDLKFN